MRFAGVHGFTMPNTVAVILAGGAGQRIGGHKPQRRLNGQRLIDIAKAHIAADRLRMAVAVRTLDQIPQVGAEQIIDANIDGPLGGVIAALHWGDDLNARFVLTIPCDMPFLPRDLFLRLASERRNEARPSVAACAGRVHPVCALWPVTCLQPVLNFAAFGQRSLKGALDTCDAMSVEWPDAPYDPFLNLNTDAEMVQAEMRANGITHIRQELAS